MKKIFSVLIMLLVFAPLSLLLCGCKTGHETLELAIKNYASYENLLIGDETLVSQAQTVSIDKHTSSMPIITLSNKEEKVSKPKLYGQKKDGTYELIVYDGDNDFEQKYHISAVQKLGEFMFMNFTASTPSKIYSTFNNSPQDYGFLIDVKTGKMYDITEYNVNLFTKGTYSYSDNAFFTMRHEKNGNQIYKYTIENNILKMSEVLDLDKVPGFGNEYTSDKYGNLFSKNGYILTTQGVLNKLTTQISFGYNRIAYSSNNWYNPNGELEEASFVPADFVNMHEYHDAWDNDNVLLKKDNVIYCRDLEYNARTIVKYTFTDDIRYTVDFIAMEDAELNDGVVVKEKIYFLKEQEVYYISIIDGSRKQISSNYFFNKLYTDNYGNVCFNAVTNTLQDVIGYINYETDEVQIEINSNKPQIFYVFPIN